MIARAKRVQQAGVAAGSAESVPPPTELPAPGWLNIFKRIWHSFSEDRILALAAGVAFYGMLALFPAKLSKSCSAMLNTNSEMHGNGLIGRGRRSSASVKSGSV